MRYLRDTALHYDWSNIEENFVERDQPLRPIFHEHRTCVEVPGEEKLETSLLEKLRAMRYGAAMEKAEKELKKLRKRVAKRINDALESFGALIGRTWQQSNDNLNNYRAAMYLLQWQR